MSSCWAGEVAAGFLAWALACDGVLGRFQFISGAGPVWLGAEMIARVLAARVRQDVFGVAILQAQ